MSQWTPDQAAEWEATWKLPIMQQGRAKLLEDTRVKGATTEYDTAEVLHKFALMAAHAQGQSDVLDKIEAMKIRKITKDLPPPFQPTPRPEPLKE